MFVPPPEVSASAVVCGASGETSGEPDAASVESADARSSVAAELRLAADPEPPAAVVGAGPPGAAPDHTEPYATANSDVAVDAAEAV